MITLYTLSVWRKKSEPRSRHFISPNVRDPDVTAAADTASEPPAEANAQSNAGSVWSYEYRKYMLRQRRPASHSPPCRSYHILYTG